jgi:hypothetical protein
MLRIADIKPPSSHASVGHYTHLRLSMVGAREPIKDCCQEAVRELALLSHDNEGGRILTMSSTSKPRRNEGGRLNQHVLKSFTP